MVRLKRSLGTRTLIRQLIASLLVFAGSVSYGQVEDLTAPSSPSSTQKKILVLTADSPEHIFAAGPVLTALKQTLHNHPELSPWEISIENLDLKMQSDNTEKAELLRQYIKAKYSDTKFDLVIAIGCSPSLFAHKNRETLFSGLPILLSGFEKPLQDLLSAENGISGVKIRLPIPELVTLARNLHPDRSNFVFIVGHSPGLEPYAQVVEALKTRLSSEIDIQVISDWTIARLKTQIQSWAKDSVIIRLMDWQDAQNHYVSNDDFFEVFGKGLPRAPVYALSESALGHGHVIGILAVRRSDIGQQLGNLASQALAGRPVSQLKPILLTAGSPVFDYPVMKLFDIDPDKAPPGSTLINSPHSFWIDPPREVLVGLAGLLVLGFIVLIIYVSLLRAKRAERKLRLSEDKWRTLLRYTPTPILTIDLEGTILYANNPYGVSKPETEFLNPVGQSVFDFANEEEVPRLKLALQNVLKEKKSVHLDMAGSRKVSDYNWYKVICGPISQDGEVKQLALVALDISDLKQTEKELRQERDFVSTILDSVPAPICVFDTEFKIVSFNPACEKASGYRSQDVQGRSFLELLVPSEEQAHTKSSLDEVLASGNSNINENQWITQWGERKHFLWKNTPIKNESGTIIYIIGTGYDLTERREKQKVIEEKKTVEASNVAKNIFLANMSHEIRTPLSAIIGYAEILCSTDASPDVRKEYLQAITRNSYHLSSLIEDTLDLSMVEAGKIRLERVFFPIAPQISSVISVFKQKCEAKGLRLRVVYENGIPEVIQSDPTRLRQVLINLLGNSVKFTDQGSVTLKIRFTVYPIPRLIFTIEDTGIGIDVSCHEGLFTPFFQGVKNKPRNHPGAGLGLALSQKIAQALGGDLILLNTTVGRGSSFQFSIDCGAVTTSRLIGNSPDDHDQDEITTALERTLEGLKILVVDDGEDNRALLQHILQSSGAKVDLAQDGLEGLHLAQQKLYNLIILDIQMPKMDGCAVAAGLRKAGCQIPLIALSADSSLEEKKRCLDCGFNSYQTKPVQIQTLIQLVLKWTRPSPPAGGPLVSAFQ